MREKKLTLSTKLKFGKYVNKNAFEIMKEDPSYFNWLISKWDGEIDWKVENWRKEYLKTNTTK